MITNKRKSRPGSAHEENHGKRIRHATSAPTEGHNNNTIHKDGRLIATASTRSQPVNGGDQLEHDVRLKLSLLNLFKLFTDRFTVEKHLGSGSYGDVYACRSKETGKQFAVKITQKTEDAQETENVYNSGREEAITLRGLNHPKILELEYFLKDKLERRAYLVFKLAIGGALFEQHGAYSEFQIRHIFAQIFAGVKYLHDNNVVHRDIKPENILIMNDDLDIQIADFGFAKALDKNGQFPEKFQVGSECYMAPEIVKMRPYGKPVDIWALGVSLYFMLTSNWPFDDDEENPTTAGTHANIVTGRYGFPLSLWSEYSSSVQDLIRNMFVMDAEARYTIEDCLKHPWMNDNLDPTPRDVTENNGAVEINAFGQERPQPVESITSEEE